MAGDDDPRPKKRSKLKFFLVFLLLLLILGGGAWYYFMSGLPGSRNAPGAETAAAQEIRVAASQEPVRDMTTMELPTFLVNLADPLGRRYIKITMEVEVASKEVIPEIERQMPKIRDSVIMLLSSKSYADLMPTENKILLKDELTARINQMLGGPKITRVFFTDLVIQ